MSLLALLLSLSSASTLSSSPFSPTDSSRPVRRFLLAAASNDGGPGRAHLRFSGDDAQGVVSVMKSLGGVLEANTFLVLEPDTGHFLSTLREVSQRMALSRDSGLRVELMLYYSGHSDEDGLLLGSTRLPYSQLRQVLQNSPAEIRLAVLDACASGAALRAKGGIRRQAFRIEGADRLRGQAFLTSSRAEESSQESDQLKGSFFTQAFLGGLRGAADADGDGRVTLLEAYNYAYRETVEKTSSTRTGPQHPEFDLDLSGSGDVVLTDLSQAGAVLDLPESLSGHLGIRDSTGADIANIDKTIGRKLSIGLTSGTWRIAVSDSSAQRVSRVELLPGSRVLLVPSPTDSIYPLAPPAAENSVTTRSPDTSLVRIAVNFGFLPPFSTNGDRANRARNNFSLDLLIGQAARIDGLQVALGVVQTSGSVSGLQAAGGFAHVGGDLTGYQGSMVAMVDGRFGGAQFGELCALSRKGGKGIQTASLTAWQGGDFTGLQTAGVAALSSGHIEGVQTSVATWTHSIHGAQLAVLNIGGSVTGVQAGVVNIASSVHGTQVGVLNLAGSSRGSQVGVVNLANNSDGAQVGVLNLADTSRGADIGVVNYANDLEAAPVGMASLGLNMRPGAQAWIEESGWSALVLRMDGRRYHVKFGGVDDISDPAHRYGCAFGWGAHWTPAATWKIETDYFGREIWSLPAHGSIQMAQWNAVSVSIHRQIGPANVFAGISYNALLTENAGKADQFVTLPRQYQYDPSDRVRLWPGIFVGAGI
jgi:hypothetical protein